MPILLLETVLDEYWGRVCTNLPFEYPLRIRKPNFGCYRHCRLALVCSVE